MKKRLILVLLCLVVAMATVVCVLLCRQPEQAISEYVLQHEVELENAAVTYIHVERISNPPGQIQLDGFFNGQRQHPIVQFSYRGLLVPHAPYYGFYYSPDDEPAAFQNADVPLEETDAGEWSWTDGTDNRGTTKRITEKWFYYETWL